MSLTIGQIRTDGGTQSRAAINEATVVEYAEAMTDPDTVFPPVTVYFDGRDYWLADGFHRVEAWKRIGRDEIPAEVRQGDRRRAILHSVAANSAHGLRRSNDDKRRAVLTLLDDDEWSQWSNREIARRCGVSDVFVGRVREGSSANGLQMEPAPHATVRTVDRGGKVYQQDTANIGKKSEPDRSQIGARSEPDPSLPPADNEARPAVTDEPPTGSDVPDTDAAERRKLAKLTPGALIEDILGLRADLAEAKAKAAKLKAENDRLKEQLKEALDDDRGEVIRRLNKSIEHKDSEMYRANEKAAAALRKMHVLTKRIKELEG